MQKSILVIVSIAISTSYHVLQRHGDVNLFATIDALTALLCTFLPAAGLDCPVLQDDCRGGDEGRG